MPSLKVIIFGCGGHGRVIHDILIVIDSVDVAGFSDDDVSKVGEIINNTLVLGTSEKLPELRSNGLDRLVLGIGDNYSRANLFGQPMVKKRLYSV